MNWAQAKTYELFVVAYDDPKAEPMDVYEALNEIKRRKQQAAERKHTKRLQMREKAHYPK